MDRRRLLLYLLLNVFVSACVTGAMLFWYDRNYRAAMGPISQSVLPTQDEAVAPLETLPPDADIPVEIVSIVGAGTLTSEFVVLEYDGETELGMAGWQLADEDGYTFTFPQLILYPEGAVRVHTSSGPDDVTDLHMNLREPIWESGEVASLYDPQHNLRANYRVP